MRNVILIVLWSVLAGCATSKDVMAPSGKMAHLIKCGSARIDLCYEKAAEVCPKGYSIVADREGANGALVTPGSGIGAFVLGPSTMFVECK
jgi:hypothetical protein